MLLSAHDPETGETMTDRQLRDEVVTMLVAGHETTANALAWAFSLLSTHPEVERRLRQELDQVLGGRAARVEDLASLGYLRRVVEETMRLYPPVWTLGRRTIEDDQIGGFPTEKGAH